MSDPYSKLRNLNKRLDGLCAQEDEAIAAVKARYAEKRKRLRAERAELVTAVKGEEEKPVTAPTGSGTVRGSEPSGSDDSELMA